MEVLHECPECADDCSQIQLPPTNSADCAEAVHDEESEICGIYVGVPDVSNPGEPITKPSDWTSQGAWDTVIGDSGTNIRYIPGIGDMPLPENNIRIISKRRQKVGRKSYTLNFDIDDLSDENYDFIRGMGCGKNVVLWFETIGGYLYGGEKGFSATVVTSDVQLDRGEGAYSVGKLVFNWKSTCSPPRVLNPMADIAA